MLKSPDVEHRDLRYRGFGVPGDLDSILSCEPWSATLVFETELKAGLEFEKLGFPIPESFTSDDGLVTGNFAMTLVYDPPLDYSYGAEYCRSNVDVSLGTYDMGAKGKPVHKKRIPEESGDLEQKYERYLIEHGFKWSPLKVYRRSITRGIEGTDWRLKVSVHHRAEFSPVRPQSFALVVTMWHWDTDMPVYDEVVRAMNRMDWKTANLQVRDEVRLPVRGQDG